MKVLACLIVIVAAVSAEGAWKLFTEEQYTTEFNKFIVEHDKVYNTEAERQLRYIIFKDNLDAITKHNEEYEAGHHTWFMGVNQFADMTNNEFRTTMLGFKANGAPSKADGVHVGEGAGPINWITKGGVTMVKNQGQCGSCWAFSTCAGVEGAVFVKHQTLTSVSPQELVDCDHNGDQGCNGGLMDNAFAWIKQNGGIASWTDYTYTARDGSCKKSQYKQISPISGHTDVGHTTSAMENALAQQPISVAVDAAQWSFYRGGIYSKACGKQLDHGVTNVGWATEGSTDYWMIKNSWGTSWGEQGYMRLKKGNNECGVLNAASYPTAQ